MNAAFNEPRHQHAGAEICAYEKRFQPRSQARTGDAAIEASHHPDFRIRERGHNTPQIAGLHTDVAIVDDDVLVPRFRDHVRQVADFGIRAQGSQAKHDPDGNLRKFSFQSLYKFNSRIIGVTDSENDFVCGILLQTMAAKALIHFRICALERLQNGNWNYGWCWAGAPARRLSLTQKSARAKQANNVIANARNGPRDGNHFEDPEKVVDHADGASLLVPQRLDGIQIRGLPRRINPKQQTLGGRRSQSERGPE